MKIIFIILGIVVLFALAMHPWYEPENNARTIAAKHGIRLLDAKIGEKVDF